MTKPKINADDITRVAGFIGGGFMGFGIADKIGDTIDAGKDLVEAVGDTIGSVGSPVMQAVIDSGVNIPGVISTKGQSAGISEGLERLVNDIVFKVKVKWLNQEADAIKKGVSAENIERWKNIIQKPQQEVEIKQKVIQLYVRNFPVYMKLMRKPEDILNMYKSKWPVEAGEFPQTVQTLNTNIEGQADDGSYLLNKLREIREDPLIKFAEEHPLHIGLTLMGAVLGEQIAQHKEVSVAFLRATGDMVPDSFSFGL